MCLILTVQSLSLGRRATTAPVTWQEVRAYSPTPLGLSCAPGNPFWPPFVEVAGVSTTPLPLAQPPTLTATPSPVISRSCASIAEVPLGLVHLGLYFGGVVMRFVEVEA